MPLSIGIVGLPNVGKSTLFTALTRKSVDAANYPFATIEPNLGVVPIPDPRLDALAEFLDIAGLVEGASKGEGLGNQFLANIRETNAVCEVVRYFTDPDVVHVAGDVDPVGDVETIRTELVLADLATVERSLAKLEKEFKRDKALAAKVDLVRRVGEWMAEGHRAGRMPMTDEERLLLRDLHLLTMKPMLYVANVDEAQLGAPLEPIDGVEPIPICAKVEAELADLEPEDAAEYLESIGLEEPGLHRLIREAYRLLGLESFFTQSEKEVRAWTIPIGTTARRAAGAVHTDFERGFIKAEVASFEDFVGHGGEHGTKAAGRLRVEGKDYVVQDGDVILFRFNV